MNVRKLAEREALSRMISLGACAGLTAAAARYADSPEASTRLHARAAELKAQMNEARHQLEAIRASQFLALSKRH